MQFGCGSLRCTQIHENCKYLLFCHFQDTPKKPPRRKTAAKPHRDHDEDDNKIKDAVNNNSDDSNASSPRQQHTTTTAYVTDDVNNSPLQSLNNLNTATTDNQQHEQHLQQQLDNEVVDNVVDGQKDLEESQMDIKEDHQLLCKEYGKFCIPKYLASTISFEKSQTLQK